MRCPECETEAAYASMRGELACLSETCTWTRRLTEDEVFALFFERRPLSACA